MACFASFKTTGEVHGAASIDRHGIGRSSAILGYRGHDPGRTAMRPGGVVAGDAQCDAGGHRCGVRHWASDGAQTAGASAAHGGQAGRAAAAVGRSTSSCNERGTRARVLGALGKAVRRGQRSSGCADSRCVGAGARPRSGRLCGVSIAGAPRLAQGGPRHSAPQERSCGAGGVEKNSPNHWRPC